MKIPKTPKTQIRKIEARALRVHPLAQRKMLPSKLKKIMETLDLDAIGVLHAVEYAINGVMAIWVIDGQHRLGALMGHGLGEWLVEVKIHMEANDDARASELFLKLNDRASIAPYDKFQNELIAEHPDAVGVARIVKERHLRIGSTGNDGYICCVSALKALYGADSGRTLRLTLDTLLEAFGHTASAVEGRLIEGLGLIYSTYNGSVEQPILVKKLSKYPGGASGLLGDSRGLRQFRKATLGRCIAERIVDLYNAGRKAGKLDAL